MRAFFVGFLFCPTTSAFHKITHTHTVMQQFDSVIDSEGRTSSRTVHQNTHTAIPTIVVNREPGRRGYFDFHIPKTAGTSFKADVHMVLPDGEGFWSRERCLLEPDSPSKTPENGDEDVGFFREPMAHVYSQFLECKYSVFGQDHVPESERVHLENVTTWLKHFSGGAERNDLNCYHPYNMQTRVMTCKNSRPDFLGVPGDGDSHHYTQEPSIDKALSNLKSLFFFGLTEHYQASLCLFHAKTHDKKSPLPTFCNCTNESAWNAFPEHRISHGVPSHSVDDLSQEDKRLIEELTQMDAELYREASEIFTQEISEVERSFDVKLVC